VYQEPLLLTMLLVVLVLQVCYVIALLRDMLPLFSNKLYTTAAAAGCSCAAGALRDCAAA
jgi:hypothetical protein